MKPQTTFHACCRLVALAACTFLGVRAAEATSPDLIVQLRRAFPQAPADAIVRRIEPPPDREILPDGLEIVQQVRRVDGLDGVLVETELRNTGAVPVAVPEVSLADLGFRLRGSDEQSPFTPLTYRNAAWYGSTFWTGPDWTRVGKDWQHPGQDTPSVRAFRAPADGRVTISGRAFKLHQAGDGVLLSIRLNDRELWTAQIDGKDGQGVEPKLSVDVRRGDTIRFIVHKRVAISCDTTGWDPVVAYHGGSAYRASEAFGPTVGDGPWSYEMLRDGLTASEWPRLHALGTDLSLFDAPAILRSRAVLSPDAVMPWFILADGTDHSGVILAAGADQGWTFQATASDDRTLRLTLRGAPPDASPLLPGQRRTLPRVFLASYQGPWTASFHLLAQFAGDRRNGTAMPGLARFINTAWRQLTQSLEKAPELDLFLLAQAEWRREDGILETQESYAAAANDHLQRAVRLIDGLKAGRSEASLAVQQQRVRTIAAAAQSAQGLDDWRRLYLETRLLKREAALANPLFQEVPAMLVTKRVPPSWSHEVAQYFGWRQRPGGGLYVVDRPGYSLDCRDLVSGRLPPGSFFDPCLAYDGRRIAFSFVACDSRVPDPAEFPVNEEGPDQRYFHIHEMDADGANLRQLTRGPYDDLMPEYLPGGDIVFCSTRRRTYSRCFGPEYSRRWHCYTIHRMDADGSRIRPLSYNDVNEWFPTVANSGEIIFARWDYIDRDAVTHQNLWAMRPDGAGARAVWGNATPAPHCTFQARPVPASGRIAFIASAHHAVTGGPLCLVDPAVDANSQAAIDRLTPGPYPEAESSQIPEYCEAFWPLSQDCFLVAYSTERLRFQGEHPSNPNPDNALGIYLLDAAGNRELIYRDPAISTTSPLPLAARPRPPVLADAVAADAPPRGEMVLADVYQGLAGVPRGTIKELRVVQIFPKATFVANQPRIGMAGEENAREILGTVPVEPDGSARFVVPARKPILFQALDADGFACQTMRSLTYVQPGEIASCVGCHENRLTAPRAATPMALGRPPSEIDPGELGGRPFSFVEVVQPLLDRHCVRCHGGEKTEASIDLGGTAHEGFTKSYWSLCGTADDWRQMQAKPELAAALLVPRFPQRNQIQVTPVGGVYGARQSRLVRLLREGGGHYDVKLDPAEWRRLAAWIDLNAIFYGTYSPEEQAAQLAGQSIPMPEIQ